MPNKSGQAYGLTTLCPIINGNDPKTNQSFAALTRHRLQELPLDDESPFAKVPNTYLSRLYVLNDVFYNPENDYFILKYKFPRFEEHLKSSYIVYTSNFHGELEPYLEGMWTHAQEEVQSIWQHCVAFDKVTNASDFIAYIKKCQVETTFYFNGSTDDSLDEQLKSLYLKQSFSEFAFKNQGQSAENLQQAFLQFLDEVQPDNLQEPTWQPGKHSL